MDSNKALTLLLVVSMIISVGGTFLILDKVSLMPFAYTGLAMSDYTVTNVTVSGAAAVSVAPTSMNLGSIQVTPGFDGANCTFQLGANDGDALIEDTGCAVSATNKGFINITNVGSTYLSIALNASKNATDFLFNYTGVYVTSPLLQANITHTNEDGSCRGTLTGSETFVTLNDSDGQDAATSAMVCSVLANNASQNEINVGLRFRVPIETLPGKKTVNVKIWAAEV